MSHVTLHEADSKDQQITDLAALQQAAEDCGMVYLEGQTSYHTWITDHGRLVGDYPVPEGYTESELGTCEHAIGIPKSEQKNTHDKYEIGVVKSKKYPGTYSLMFDFYGGAIENRVGNDKHKLGKLMQKYQENVYKKTAKRAGDTIRSTTTLDDGSVVMRVNTTARMGG